MNFDEMILEAAKSIAAATSALIKAASAAQRELITTGKVSREPVTSSDDGQWSEGLISAARLVAAATHSLVESANALVQGVSSEEKLISSAKQVASSTAQLLVACKVKADPDSDSTKRLLLAGNSVKRATDNLVKAAQQAIKNEEERSLVLNKRMVGGIAQEINARSEVLRIEKELEEARGRLTAIRQAKYKNRNESSDTENDNEQNNYDNYSSKHDNTNTNRNDTIKSPIHIMNNTLEQLKPTTQQISHIANDRDKLVSPEKVYSTQSTLERKMKNDHVTFNKSNINDNNSYGTLGQSKYNNDYKYQIDTSPTPYTVTDRIFTTENSPAQYSSIERKINQEFDTTELKNSNYDNKKYNNDIIEGPFSPLLSQIAKSIIPKSPNRKTFDTHEQLSFNKFTNETNQSNIDSRSYEQRTFGIDHTDEIDSSKYYQTNEKYHSPMSTFKSDRSSINDQQQHQQQHQRCPITSGITQNQSYKNIENNKLPGGHSEAIITKIYTSTPGKTMSSSNFEKTEHQEFTSTGNDMKTFKSLTDRNNIGKNLNELIKKESVTQKITEQKTITTKVSKHLESHTKTFRYEGK